MYETIEAELRDGKLVPLEPGSVPLSGRVLVTILEQRGRMPDWAEVRKHLGWLKRPVDGAKWQREVRSQWSHRP